MRKRLLDKAVDVLPLSVSMAASLTVPSSGWATGAANTDGAARRKIAPRATAWWRMDCVL